MPDLGDVARKAEEIQREMERPLRECRAELARVEEQRDYFLRESEANGEAADNLTTWLKEARAELETAQAKLSSTEQERDSFRTQLEQAFQGVVDQKVRAKSAETRERELREAVDRFIDACERAQDDDTVDMEPVFDELCSALARSGSQGDEDG